VLGDPFSFLNHGLTLGQERSPQNGSLGLINFHIGFGHSL